MKRKSKQHPRDPVGPDSFFYDPELSDPEPPERIVAVPDESGLDKRNNLRKLESIFAKSVYVAIVFFSLSLTGVMFAQVLLRYVFESPFVGIEEVALLLGAWLYFLGLVYVTRNGEHIHGGVLTLVVKNPNTVRAVRLLMTVLSILACAIFGFFAIKYALFEIQTGRLSSYMRWPKGLWSSSLIAGFVGTQLYLILQLANQILDLKYRLAADRRP